LRRPDSDLSEGHLLGENDTPRKHKSKQPKRRVRIGAPDPTVTGLAGLVAVDELTARGLVAELDRGIGPIKARDRGLTGGQLLVGMATAQLAGQDHLVGMDRVRADPASTLLTTAPIAPIAPSRTVGRLAGHFGPDRLRGIEAGLTHVYTRWLASVPASVRGPLVLRHPTIDLDATDIEVHGRTKQGVGWNYAGVRSGRVHLASWAHAQLPLAMDLTAGNDDVRPHATDLLTRALQVLPAAVCGRRCRVRADAGYFDAALANGADALGCDFAIAAKRNSASWPEGTYTLVRRVKTAVKDLSDDPRSRRWRTVHKDQLALACDGLVDHVWAVSFIVTNIPANAPDLVGLEAWFRDRTAIEERFREAKHGAGLNHLPSADPAINAVWTWAGLLACDLAVMLQTLTGLDTHPDQPGRMRIATRATGSCTSPDV
jgi:hypothetical protein